MAIDDDIAFLQRVPTIGPLGRAALRILAIGAETRHLNEGDVLFSAGEGAEDGTELTGGPGTLLGEVPLFAETKRTATATALEPAAMLYISRPLFVRMLDSFPDAAHKLRETFAGRLDLATREITNVGTFLDAHEPK